MATKVLLCLLDGFEVHDLVLVLDLPFLEAVGD